MTSPPLKMLLSVSALFAALGGAIGRADERPSLLLDSIRPAGATHIGVTPLESIGEGHTWIFKIPAPRGQITTRTGQAIAFSKSAQRLVIRLAEIAVGEEEAVAALKNFPPEILKIKRLQIPDEAKIRAHFKNRRWIPIPISGELSELEIAAVDHLQVPGLGMETVYSRVYPQGKLFGHMVGYIGDSMPDQHGPVGSEEFLWPPTVGRAGLEKTLEKNLVGTAGKISRLFDEKGKVKNQEIARRPRPGLTVVTSLNFRMQKLAAQALARNSRPGAFIAVNADTGEILAMVSQPAYDPNEFLHGISTERFREIADDKEAPLFDRVVSGAYPPGSTFKPFVALAALDSGTVNGKETRYPGPPSLRIGGRNFKNWYRGTEPDMDVRYALLRSCNTWFYQVGIDTGPDPIYRSVKQFGLTQAPDIPLEGVSPGMMPKNIAVGDEQALANFSIGQGDVLVSPLQLVLAMSALANGHFVPKPQLILQLRDPLSDEVVFQNRPQKAHRLSFSEEDIDLVRAGMFGVVNHPRGTARGARMSRPRVYGKTGTSQWAEDGEKRSLAWFAGWVDSEDPKIAFVALSQGRPGEKLSGGGNAAPVASRFLSKVFSNPHTYAVNRPTKLLHPDPDLQNAAGYVDGQSEPVEIVLPPRRNTFGGLLRRLFGRRR